MTLDLTKPVQTRDGRPARIIATDVKNSRYPVVAIIGPDDAGDDIESVHTFTLEGGFYSGEVGGDDLVNVPEEKITYFALYSDGDASKVASFEKLNDFAKGGHPYGWTGVHVALVTVDGKFKRLDVL